MTHELPKFDVDRATAILSKAKEVGYYPDPLPDDDATRVTEAEKIVQLALQADRVAREAGADKVPSHDAINAVLFEAHVTGGSEELNQVKVIIDGVEDEWAWDQVVTHILDNGNTNLELPNVEDAKRLAAERIRREQDVESSGEATAGTAAGVGEGEPASDPAPVQHSPSPEAPSDEEAWVDANGQIWIIETVLKSGFEVHLHGGTEKTVVPRDFLVKRVEVDQPKEESSLPPSSRDSATASAPSSISPSPTPSPETEEAGTTSPDVSPGVSPSSSESSSDDPEYQELIDRVRKDYERARLPLPADVERQPTMPEDLTNAQDIHARQLHSAFNACAARARYLMGLERQTKIGCERLKKQVIKPAMKTAREQLGDKATLAEVKQVAEDHQDVVKWNERAELHSDRESAYRDLFDIYESNVAVLSRDWTMRDKESRGS